MSAKPKTETTPEAPAGGGEPKTFTMPPAFHQAAQPRERMLESANCGVIIQRTAQLRGKYRSEGRQFARELATYINEKQLDVATVFVFEETFGTKERLHWFIHLRSLDVYPTMVAMGAKDEEFRELVLRERVPGGGRWDVMFLDGSLQETVLVPQAWQGRPEGDGAAPVDRVTAGEQTSLEGDDLLTTASASSVVQISGSLIHQQAAAGRQALRRQAERFNCDHAGRAVALLYEEAFGGGERVHCLVHLASLGSYRLLAGTFTPGAVSAPEAAGRTDDWRQAFVDGSLREVGLTPQFWGMYATQAPAG